MVEWLRYYNWHDFITGLLITQADRFLALYWHAEYKGRVSPGLATKVVLGSKVILLLPISVAAGVSPTTLQCVDSPVLECASLAKLELSLVLMEIPVLATFTAVVALSLYVCRVRRRSSQQSTFLLYTSYRDRGSSMTSSSLILKVRTILRLRLRPTNQDMI